MTRYYLKTTDRKYLKAYEKIQKVSAARVKKFREIARSWGFDEIACEDFGTPMYFFKEVDGGVRQKGPEIEGFKGGSMVSEAGRTFYKYSFHGKNKTGTELRKQLSEAPVEPLPKELWGKHHHRLSIDAVFAARFGLPDGVFSERRLKFAMVYRLRGDVLVCSLPYCSDKTSNEYKPVVIPKGCEEITGRAWAEMIDEHNAAVKAEKAA